MLFMSLMYMQHISTTLLQTVCQPKSRGATVLQLKPSQMCKSRQVLIFKLLHDPCVRCVKSDPFLEIQIDTCVHLLPVYIYNTCVHLQYFEPNSDLHLHTTVKKHSDISNKILILYFCAKSKQFQIHIHVYYKYICIGLIFQLTDLSIF